MHVNEMLDQAFKGVEIAQSNARIAAIAIKQRDIMREALEKIALLDYESLSVTDWQCLRDAIATAKDALTVAEMVNPKVAA